MTFGVMLTKPMTSVTSHTCDQWTTWHDHLGEFMLLQQVILWIS